VIYALMIENFSGGMVSLMEERTLIDEMLSKIGRKVIAESDPEKWGTGKAAEAGQRALMQAGGPS
jgi:hypothetical protein